MKKKLFNISILLLLAIITFHSIAFINPQFADDQWHQYNYNPEKTNTLDLLSYKLALDQGAITEEYVFVDITEYNNLTNQGVKDLVNDGYLHSYIPALIEAGRLPEGFTPTSDNTNTPSAPEQEVPKPEPPTSEAPNTSEKEETDSEASMQPPAQQPDETDKPTQNTQQNTKPDNSTQSGTENAPEKNPDAEPSENEELGTEELEKNDVTDNSTQSEMENVEDTEVIESIPSTEDIADREDLDKEVSTPWEIIIAVAGIVVAGCGVGAYFYFKKHK